MDSGSWALVGVALLGLAGTVYGVRNTRRSAKETTEVAEDGIAVDRFEAILQAYDAQAKDARAQAKEAVAEAKDLAKRVGVLERKDEERDRQLTRIRQIVQAWFRELRAQWPIEHSMPLPSIEDMELLGITAPRAPH